MRQRLAILFSLTFLVLVGALFFLWRNLGAPQYEGVVSSPLLNEQVVARFDNFGIAHIDARNERDAFFSLGYIMASERLFQMDLTRRLAKGELSELFGPKTIEVDKLFRTLGLSHHFKKKYSQLPQLPYIQSMQAFYEGVNEFIRKGPKPREYYLLGATPAPFDVHDGYATVGYMAYTFAMALKTDLLYNEIKEKEGSEVLNDIRIYHRSLKTRTVRSKSHFLHNSSFEIAQRWIEENLSSFTGSNAWVLAPRRSKSGGAILANDPHVRISSPGLWYEAHMKWPEHEVYGHFVPGLPFSAMGHNSSTAWGLTISYVDNMDFYLEKRRAHEIFHQGVWKKIDRRVEKIKVAGSDTVEHVVEVGPHGPLLDRLTRLDTSAQESVAMSWSHFHPDNDPAHAFYSMMLAKDQESFKKSLVKAKSPGLNILYADKQGNIARYLYGAYPIRPDYMIGDLIYPGDDPLYEVSAELEFSKRAHIENPASGIIVSANQRPEEPGHTTKGYYQPNDRYISIHHILSGQEKWSLEELKYVQTANVNVFNTTFKEATLKVLNKGGLVGPYSEAQEVLKNWDGFSTKDSAGALIFHQFFFELERELLSAKLKKYYLRLCDLTSFWHRTKRMLISGTVDQQVIKAFRQSVDRLSQKYGKPSNWRWGKAHTLEFVHPIGRSSKVMASLFNYGPFEMDGGFNHINNLRRQGCKDDFKIKVGPSTRRLIDMSMADVSYGVLPMGNSSHLYSPFYADQFELFSHGKYRAQLLKPNNNNIFSTLLFTKEVK